MASTRPPRLMQIFQDPIRPARANTTTHKPKPQLQPSAMPLQPIENLPAKRDVNMQPPHCAPPQRSPSKIFHLSSPPLRGHPDFAYVSIPPPPNHHGYTDSLTKDRAVIPMPMPMPPRPYIPPVSQRPLFTTFPSTPMEPLDKENYHHIPSHNENFADFPDPSYARNRPLKRSMSEVSNFDRPFKRVRPDEEQMNYLPEPEDMPVVEDEGCKPCQSYANLIGMAILRGPNRRLTLAQIYKWISDTYTFYRGGETGWQNSIRHNLSLNKAFQKQERPKGDSGKGNYWTIAPGMEMQFVKEKTSRKGTAVANLSVQPQMVRHEAPQPLVNALAPQNWLDQAPSRPQTARAQPTQLAAVSADTAPEKVGERVAEKAAATAPKLPEFSSDATLPGSDPALHEEDVPSLSGKVALLPQSSPVVINSSPPMPAPPYRRRRDTISPCRIAPASSGHNRKRKTVMMDDSGYFSSLESSALRPNKAAAPLLTSELDVERPKMKKRGRAEEEIARIRGSSHEVTPSHLRFQDLNSDQLTMSSPFHGNYDKAAPVTPAMMSKKPIRPPPSISPNTHLRNHRKQVQDLVNSPSRMLGGSGLSEELVWSPYFKLCNPMADGIYDFTAPSTPALGSPLKRSAKRPSLNRASSTPGKALQDLTNTNTRLNAKTPSRDTMLKPLMNYNTPKSPSKMMDSLPLPESDSFFNFDVFDDDNNDEGLSPMDDGVDILQGFRKIGGVVPPPTQLSPLATRRNARQLLARSSTSRF